MAGVETSGVIRQERPYEAVRTQNCGQLRLADVGSKVTLAGWVQLSRDKGHFCFVDLRDRYGLTQIVVPEEKKEMYETAKKAGREWVLRVKGTVVERSNKNPEIATGDVEVIPDLLEVLNTSLVPPFLIKDETDGHEELRMKFRYLDIRRAPVRDKLILRSKVAQHVRSYLTNQGFCEIETPFLVKSTPEGARDFVVPSRMNPGTFYALPQSPQLFKQLLMVGGMDRYFQIVKCFRDEELRADRQPEFTQIDCEMSFVEQEDVMNMFEGLARHVFKEVKGLDIPAFPRMSYDYALKYYGIDKPDVRFDMKFVEITDIAKGKGFKLFDDAEIVVGIKAENVAEDYTKSKITEITELAKSGDIGAAGLIWVKVMKDGSIQSSVGKFFNDEALKGWVERFAAKPNDMLLVIAGSNAHEKTRVTLGRFRNAMGSRLGLRKHGTYKCLWVVDFPLLEWDEDAKRWHAAHHPFTSPYRADIPLLDSNPGAVRALAYDMVINGVEVGGGSIRIHDRPTQELMLKHLGFSKESAEEQFGFLMKAFEYGAPPHGGLAFGMDRLTSLLGEFDSIRECIAFPKNNQGRDTMMDAPSVITQEQLDELHIAVVAKEKKAAEEKKAADEKK